MLAVVSCVSLLASADTYVAEVGGQKYTKFSAAFQSMTSENSVLTLLADCDSEPGLHLPLTGDTTINLNGKTLTVASGADDVSFLDDGNIGVSGSLVLTNGMISLSTGGLIDIDNCCQRVLLQDLVVNSTADVTMKGRHLVYVCGGLTIDRCVMICTSCGCAAVSGGTGTFTDSVFSVARVAAGVDPMDLPLSCRSACVLARDGAQVTVKNCQCYGADAAKATPWTFFEHATGANITVKGGFYNGPLRADCHSDTQGIRIEGGTFVNCLFTTRNNHSGHDYYRLSGGAYDNDPRTNGCRYVESGFCVDYDTPANPGLWSVSPVDWHVADTNFVYDGFGHGVTPTCVAPQTATFTYALSQTGPFSAVKPLVTNASEKTVWVRLVDNDQVLATASAKVKVSPRPVTLTSGSQKWTYDGLWHSNTTITVSGDGFAGEEGVRCKNFTKIRDVDTKKNTFLYDPLPGTTLKNYAFSFSYGELEILPAGDVEIWIAAQAVTNDYTGVAQTNVGFEIVGSTSEIYKRSDFVFTGCSNLVETAAGTYRMNLKQADFAKAEGSAFNAPVVHVVQDGELVINKVEAKRAGGLPVDAYTRDPSDPTKPYSQFDIVTVYDGKGTNIDFKAIKAIKLDPPTTETYEFATTAGGPWKKGTTKFINVVSTSVWYRITSPNTFDYVHEVKLCITNRPAKLTSATEQFTYDGNWHSNLTVVAENFVKGEGVVTNNFPVIRDFGAISNSFDFAAAKGTKLSNYAITCVTGEISVVQAPMVNVTVSAKAVTNAYTGVAQRNDGFSFEADLPTFGWDCFSFSGCSNLVETKAGEYRMNLAPSQFALTSPNYAVANFVIAQDGVLVITNVPPVTPEGPVDPVNPDPEDPSKPFSSYDVTAGYDGSGHTIDTNALSKLAYVPPSTLTLSYALTKDGAWQADPFVFTNVVTTSFWYKVSSTGADDFVHVAKLTVTNRPVRLESASDSWTFDGQWHSNATVTAEGLVDGESFRYAGMPRIRDVGEVTNVFTVLAGEGTRLSNYAIERVEGLLTVEPSGFQFVESALEVEEGGSAVVRIRRSRADTAAQVTLTRVNGTGRNKSAFMDGARVSFPLTLNWAKGDLSERTVVLVTSESKSVQPDKFFTLQLSAPVGETVLESGSVCKVTVVDAQGGAPAKPYVRALAYPANAGRVSGFGELKRENSYRTLRTSPKRFATFAGWYRAKADDENTIDFERPVEPFDARYPMQIRVGYGTDNEAGTYFAYYTNVLDVAAVVEPQAFDAETGKPLPGVRGILAQDADNGVYVTMVGTQVELPVDFIDASGAGRLRASKLPSGLSLKRDAKTGESVIRGVPTKAGSFEAKFVASNAADKHTITYTFVVTDIPANAVGTFYGLISDDPEGVRTGVGSVAFTAGKSGSLSAKVMRREAGVRTFKGKGYSFVDVNTLAVALTNANGEVFEATLALTNGWHDTALVGAAFGGNPNRTTLAKYGETNGTFVAVRSALASKDADPEAQQVLAAYFGTYDEILYATNGVDAVGVVQYRVNKNGSVYVAAKLDATSDEGAIFPSRTLSGTVRGGLVYDAALGLGGCAAALRGSKCLWTTEALFDNTTRGVLGAARYIRPSAADKTATVDEDQLVGKAAEDPE